MNAFKHWLNSDAASWFFWGMIVERVSNILAIALKRAWRKARSK